MSASTEETKVYVPDAQVAWVEATVVQGHIVNDKTVQVILQHDPLEESDKHPSKGTTRTVAKESIMLQNLQLGDNGCADMVNLSYLHEPTILYNLKQRFSRKIPYTYAGPICIAVNPYTWLDIYTENLQDQFLDRDRSELPPHVYAISAGSYQHMKMFGEAQSILVSGESGAGKTETTKILMSHLAVAGGHQNDGAVETSIIERVLQANPLMESFGNAKTCRNDNSSRFGKFSELQFNAVGQLIGAKSRTYLLEKSRVSTHAYGERNYHIFYQLLAAPQEIKESIHLNGKSSNDFPFVQPRAKPQKPSNGKPSITTDMSTVEPLALEEGIKDAEKFLRTVACLETLGISKEDQMSIFKTISAILHLSQLQFDEIDKDEDTSQLLDSESNMQEAKIVCKLLDFQLDAFSNALCNRMVSLSSTETYQVPLTTQQAQQAQIALAVALYSHLFGWLIHRVNSSTCASHRLGANKVTNKIGILDIFGFEVFEKNSFEQLCINYANEKLQQKFTQDVFKVVQNEYEEEGIPWKQIDFQDNFNVLTLIEGRFGVLALLNEECMRPRGNDAAFANKVKAHYADHERFEAPRIANNSFVIDHYAGKVQYDTFGFVSKNTDALANDLLVLIQKSQSDFVKRLFQNEQNAKDAPSKATSGAANAKNRTSIINDSVATQFKSQLNGLIEEIRRTNVHYVRCIKPNNSKSAEVFNKKRVTEQLQCAGIVEAIRISRCAFPYRILQTVFLDRFRCLSNKSKVIFPVSVDSASPDELRKTTQEFLSYFLPHEAEDKKSRYEIGKSRVFFSKGTLEELEEKRTQKLSQAAVCVQRHMKMWLAVAHFHAQKRSAQVIQSIFRSYRLLKAYRTQRCAVLLIQTVWRVYLAKRLLAKMKKQHAATEIQRCFKGYVLHREYIQRRKSVIMIQSVVRRMLAMRTFVIIQNEIKEDAKLENQIQLLKQRLAQEKSARLALEQAAKATSATLVTSTATSAYSGLEDADLVIEMLRKENTALKEANRTLKVSNVQLKKEKDVMERGAYVNGASFAAANHRASKLQEDLELLKGAHQKIKLTHRLLKQQNMSMMEKNTLLHQQFQEKTQEITNVIREKQAITHELDKMNKENAALAKANARLRLILRQDADLSRKHRDELPNLTKVAYSIKHGSTAVVDIAVDSASNAPAATNVVASTPAALSIIEKPILGMTIKKMTHGAPQAKPVYSETANYTMVNFSTLEPSTNAHIAGTSTPATGSPDSITPIGRALQLEGFKKAQGEAAKTARVVNVVPKSEEGNVSDNNELATATHTSSLGNKILRVRMEERNGATNNSSDIIRQPVGSDGPIIDTEKVMGLIDDEKENIEDTNARVRFHVTLNIDPEEEKLKQEKHLKQTHQTFFNSTKDCKGKTNANNGAAYRTRGGRRGSYDGGQRAYRGSYDGDERTHRDSLTENLMGGHGGRTRRGSYDKNYNAGAPKFNNKHPRKRGSGGKKIEL